MKNTAFLLAWIASSAVAAPPRFAEDLVPEVGYSVVLKLVPGDDGRVRFCTLHSVREGAPEGQAVNVTPGSAYLADACRKLSTKKWTIERDAAGEIKAVFYFCRYVESVPAMAYCERRFGD